MLYLWTTKRRRTAGPLPAQAGCNDQKVEATIPPQGGPPQSCTKMRAPRPPQFRVAPLALRVRPQGLFFVRLGGLRTDVRTAPSPPRDSGELPYLSRELGTSLQPRGGPGENRGPGIKVATVFSAIRPPSTQPKPRPPTTDFRRPSGSVGQRVPGSRLQEPTVQSRSIPRWSQ